MNARSLSLNTRRRLAYTRQRELTGIQPACIKNLHLTVADACTLHQPKNIGINVLRDILGVLDVLAAVPEIPSSRLGLPCSRWPLLRIRLCVVGPTQIVDVSKTPYVFNLRFALRGGPTGYALMLRLCHRRPTNSMWRRNCQHPPRELHKPTAL